MKRVFMLALVVMISAFSLTPCVWAQAVGTSVLAGDTVTVDDTATEPTSGDTATSSDAFILSIDVNETYTGETAEDMDEGVSVEQVRSNKFIYVTVACVLIVVALVVICVKARKNPEE